jgi:flagellar biosynthesis component FlhA
MLGWAPCVVGFVVAITSLGILVERWVLEPGTQSSSTIVGVLSALGVAGFAGFGGWLCALLLIFALYVVTENAARPR